jgi:hypothetical protein
VGFFLSCSVRQVSVHSFQLISGLVCLNHGYPSITFCFPSPVTRRLWVRVCPLIVKSSQVYFVIVPRLLGVPSTLKTSMGYFNSFVSIFWFQTKFWLMNFPPAPVSNKVVVSTIFFCPRLSPKIKISTFIVFFSIWATCTCSIDMEGEADVGLVLRFKNPPHLYPPLPSS